VESIYHNLKPRHYKFNFNSLLFANTNFEMNRVEKLYDDWKKLTPFKFVLTTTGLIILLTIPFAIIFELVGISDKNIGGPTMNKFGLIESILLAVIIAPLIETYLGQALPIYLVQKFVKWKTNIVAIGFSTLLFSLGHVQYSIWYFILVAPVGLLLASTYIIFQDRKESAFWITCFVHSLRNAIAVLFSFSELIK
jgi:membrane protease YdiL (CAAX protease family)